jgi:hypothetical protein
MSGERPRLRDYFQAIFLQTPEEVDWVTWSGRAAVIFILFLWSLGFWTHSLESNYVGTSFLHSVALAFHEGGHIVFTPFGRFLTVAGGSLMQLLIPLAVMVSLLLKNRNAVGGAVGLWWMGQNLMDLAPYINDARDLNLILLGGYTGKEVEGHDWEYLLKTTGLIRQDHFLGHSAHWLGAALMALALVWAIYMLYRQFQVARQG